MIARRRVNTTACKAALNLGAAPEFAYRGIDWSPCWSSFIQMSNFITAGKPYAEILTNIFNNISNDVINRKMF